MTPQQNSIITTKYLIAIILLVIAYLSGAYLAIMPIDAAQYASISREMLDTGNFWSVQHQYKAYLDKPPLLFWLSAASFRLFGYTELAYRLPSLLAAIGGVYATYRLAKLLYDRTTGYWAALILASSQAYFLFCHDIRTDTLLTAFVMMAIALFYEWLLTSRLIFVVGAFTAVALAMLSKGPIGAVVPILAIGSYVVVQGQQKTRFALYWIGGTIWILLLLLPMLWGLYLQYGERGIAFYFWEQSFGRITGQNRWRNQTGALFFVHTFLWAFLPYSLLAIGALLAHIKNIFANWRNTHLFQLTTLSTPENSLVHPKDAIPIGGFLLGFIALSFSQYKLPHYIFVLFPLAAIFTANALTKGFLQHRFWHIFQLLIGFLLCIASLLIVFWVFPETTIVQKIGVLCLCSFWFFIETKRFFRLFGTDKTMDIPLNKLDKKQHQTSPIMVSDLLYSSFIAIVIFNLVLNTIFYPHLTKYESGYVAAQIFQGHIKSPSSTDHQLHTKFANTDFSQTEARSYGVSNHAFDFYTRQSYQPIVHIDSLVYRKAQYPLAIYTDEAGLHDMDSVHLAPIHVDTLPHFAITRLNIRFLSPQNRPSQVQKRFLVWLPTVN